MTFSSFVSILFFYVFIAIVGCDTWAILLSGVYEWNHFAYSAESDIYQAYYQLIENGISPDHIIVFCMNGVAYSKSNPYPGEVYNYDGGPNTYPRIQHNMDYVLENNTWENFLKVIQGEDMTGIGSGKTLKSTKDDVVLVYSWQHGDVGYLCWYYENSRREVLYADLLLDAIRNSENKGMFKHFAWYMLSCYAGSIFNKEFENESKYLFVTAATPERHGLACGYSKSIGTWINGCMHMRDQKFIRENMKDLDKISLFEMYVSNYRDKLEEPELVEVICSYGNLEYAKNHSVNSIFGMKITGYKKEVYKTRDLEVVNIPTSIKNYVDVEEYPEFFERFEDREEDQCNEYPDANIGLCDVFPKLNHTCIHLLIPRLIELDPSEQCIWDHFDYIRLKCSSSSTDVEDMYKDLKPYCEKFL